MKLGSIYMIQRPKNTPRNGDIVVPCVKTQKSSSKVLASVFWDKDGIFLVDYLGKVATITAEYYFALIDKLKQQLVSKRRSKLSKGICSSRQCCSSQSGNYAPEIGRSSL
jgi:hypothetical protein